MAKDKGSFGQNAGKAGVVYILREMDNHHKLGKRKTHLFKIGESTRSGKIRAEELTNEAVENGSNVSYEFITEIHTQDCYRAEQLIFKKLEDFRLGAFGEWGGNELFEFVDESKLQNAIKVIRETCAEVDAEHKRQESKKAEPEKSRQVRTHYDNLKVARNAPDALIKAAYKVLLQQYHPDKVEVAKQTEALRITQIIREAYDVLSDPVQRAEHDAWIKTQENQSRSHKPEQPDINVNEAREKEKFRRRETEKAEAEKQRQAQEKENLKRQEAQRAYDAILKRQAQEKEAENKTGCLSWIIGFAVIYVLIVATGTNTESVSQTGSATNEPVKPIVIKRETPNGYTKANRYHDNGDGTVKDLETNLEWMRCSLGQNLTSPTCEGQATKYNWNHALVVGENFKFAGHSDWRMPTIDELKTLVYCSSGLPQTWNNTGEPCEGNYDKPTIVREAFPNTPNYFWSSSIYSYSK